MHTKPRRRPQPAYLLKTGACTFTTKHIVPINTDVDQNNVYVYAKRVFLCLMGFARRLGFYCVKPCIILC